jgi:predicted nucleotidyltransferase component of viral defense system
MENDYPKSLQEVASWAAGRKATLAEGKIRFAQYGILHAIGLSAELRRILVFKGGNALDFVWMPNRSTKDLDFSAVGEIDADSIRDRFDRAFQAVQNRLGTHYRVQKVEARPRINTGKDFITYAVSVGYVFDDQKALIARLNERKCPQIIDLDISINEIICDHAPKFFGAENEIKVSTLEDIVAEKLRSFLQQKIRKRNREQDLLDIATVVSSPLSLDLIKVKDFLIRKSNARDIVVTKALFRDDELKNRSQANYESLRQSSHNFIPFEQAIVILYQFVDSLDME